MQKLLKGRKTHIIAGIMVVKAVFLVIIGDMTIIQFVASNELNTIMEACGLSSLRAGVAKVLGGKIG